MTQKTKYPYQLVNMFVISISLKRATKLAEKVEMPTQVSIQYTEPSFPRVQVAMKIATPEDALIPLELQVVGIFDYIGSQKQYDKNLNREFAEERAFHMLWVYSIQMIKSVSTQMGMKPLELRIPKSFNILDETKLDGKKKSKPKKQKKPA
jgi:hypothetical protein